MAPDGSRARTTTTPTSPATTPTERRVRMPDGTGVVVRTWPAAPESAGSATPILLCDGLGCDGFVWRYVIDRFAGERPIIHVHYRGHGRSDVPSDIDSARIEVIIDDLGRVLDELDVERAVLPRA